MNTNLTPKEFRVLSLKNGYDVGDDWNFTRKQRTLEEVAKICGVTRERIRQIETKAIEKLRQQTSKP